MTTIRTTCPICGEVGLTPEEIELWVDPEGARAALYAFVCPSCLQVIEKPADRRIVGLLISGGVPVREFQPERPGGPPLTYDDLLDFHNLLETDNWFDLLVDHSRR